MKVKLIATAAYGYGGVRIAPGQEFEANRTDARTLVAIGKARHYEAAALQAEPANEPDGEPEVSDKQKRAYNRRDMKAK
jgi:hypothetical protein